MVKLFLSILILLSCGLAGLLKAKSYDNRVSHIQDYISAIGILESEMHYRLDPLPELFTRMGHANENLAGQLFTTAAKLLTESENRELALFWKDATAQVYEGSSLSSYDIEIIGNFGMELGQTDMDNQRALFARSRSLMEVQLAEALDEKKVKGKMYKSLGVAIGAFIVIILV